MTDLVVIEEFSILAQQVERVEIVAVAEQGPPGPPGPPGEVGPIGDSGGAFLVNNRFFEIAEDEPAKQVARENLGLAVIDGGTFN